MSIDVFGVPVIVVTVGKASPHTIAPGEEGASKYNRGSFITLVVS